jgi:hypothetical protein
MKYSIGMVLAGFAAAQAQAQILLVDSRPAPLTVGRVSLNTAPTPTLAPVATTEPVTLLSVGATAVATVGATQVLAPASTTRVINCANAPTQFVQQDNKWTVSNEWIQWRDQCQSNNAVPRGVATVPRVTVPRVTVPPVVAPVTVPRVTVGLAPAFGSDIPQFLEDASAQSGWKANPDFPWATWRANNMPANTVVTRPAVVTPPAVVTRPAVVTPPTITRGQGNWVRNAQGILVQRFPGVKSAVPLPEFEVQQGLLAQDKTSLAAAAEALGYEKTSKNYFRAPSGPVGTVGTVSNINTAFGVLGTMSLGGSDAGQFSLNQNGLNILDSGIPDNYRSKLEALDQNPQISGLLPFILANKNNLIADLPLVGSPAVEAPVAGGR